jgi:alpha-aminoadipic semialdehyde synthase
MKKLLSLPGYKNHNSMNNIFGIRHEDKYALERRVAITPAHLENLVKKEGLEAFVQTSPKRVFTDDQYIKAGAEVVDNLGNCDVIFGVKEMPVSFFERNKTYIFFSHVIKGQPYNMPMLKHMMDYGVNLIDYEKVEDEMGRRLIFFGRFAGLAGMINSLWSLGMRYEKLGIDTPFKALKQSHKYDSLEDAKSAISEVGMKIAAEGLPEEITPLTFGVTGYGNVSKGAQEIINLLPVMEITPEQLLNLKEKENLPRNVVYKIVFMEKDLSVHKETPEKFELQNYYQHPEEYVSAFEKYIPHISCLMNCMYWDDRYPRIVTKSYLKKLYKDDNPKLTVIGDVTCDPDGSIECTHKGTEIEDPVFVYDPATGKPESGFDGNGVLVMAVDILPSELPKEASEAFSNALNPYLKEIVTCDYNQEFDALTLPAPIKRAMILHKGKLTPDFEYIKEYL